jgi:hypothetical protein
MTRKIGQWGAKELGTRMLGEDSWDKKAWAGQPEKTIGMVRRTRKRGQDGQNMTNGQGSWDRAAGTGQLKWDNNGSKVGV